MSLKQGRVEKTFLLKGVYTICSVVIVPDGSLSEHLTDDITTEQDIVVDTSRIRQEPGMLSRFHCQRPCTITWGRENPPVEVATFDYAAEDEISARLWEKPQERECVQTHYTGYRTSSAQKIDMNKL